MPFRLERTERPARLARLEMLQKLSGLEKLESPERLGLRDKLAGLRRSRSLKGSRGLRCY